MSTGPSVSGSVREIAERQEDGFDLPPEYCHYRDEGCEFAASCLGCPYPNCVYEQSGGKRRWLKKMRDKEILQSFAREGRRIKELAQEFGVSQRTIQRALGRTRNE